MEKPDTPLWQESLAERLVQSDLIIISWGTPQHWRGFLLETQMNQLNLFDDLYENEESMLYTEQDDTHEVNTETKVCRICNLEKSVDEFFLDRGKLYSKCRECFKKYNQDLKIVHKNAPPKPERCECCGKIPTKWACDHYPNSTDFRGWVCWECNNAAGSVGDSYIGAVKLLNYLYQRHKH